MTGGQQVVERARALLLRRRAQPPHAHRLDLPPERVPGEPVPTGRCGCGAIGMFLRDLAGPEWAWLGVVAPDLADRVVWLSPGQYAAALHQVPPQGEENGEDAEPRGPVGLRQL